MSPEAVGGQRWLMFAWGAPSVYGVEGIYLTSELVLIQVRNYLIVAVVRRDLLRGQKIEWEKIIVDAVS